MLLYSVDSVASWYQPEMRVARDAKTKRNQLVAFHNSVKCILFNMQSISCAAFIT